MQSAGFRASMSRKADCYDNAPMESFFHTLKTELVHHRHYATREQADVISLLTSRDFCAPSTITTHLCDMKERGFKQALAVSFRNCKAKSHWH